LEENMNNHSNIRRALLVFALVAMLVVAIVPASAQSSAYAITNGQGSAAAAAFTIGGVSYSQSAAFGNALASAYALGSVSPFYYAYTYVATTGSTGAAISQAQSGPAGSSVFVQAQSLFGSTAYAYGFASP
jgi:hypothetical protein